MSLQTSKYFFLIWVTLIFDFPCLVASLEPIVVDNFALPLSFNNSNPRQDVNNVVNSQKNATVVPSSYLFNTKLPNLNALNPNNTSNSSACATNAAQDEQDRFLNRVTLILLIVLFCFYVVSLGLSLFGCYLLYKRNKHFY